MNAVIYPVHFHRNFERRLLRRMAGLEPRRSRSEGTDTCERGNVVGALGDSSNSPTGVINEWRWRPVTGDMEQPPT
jgi:hypothetical protein